MYLAQPLPGPRNPCFVSRPDQVKSRPMLSAAELKPLEVFVVDLNRAAADVILPLFRADHGLEDKNAGGRFDPVTAADRGAEAAIRALISERYPTHGVIGEEYGEDRANAEFVWVIDPVDGTRAFIAGLPLWTTLIGLRFQGVPALGSIGQPFLDEIYVGHAGGSRLIQDGSSRALAVRKGVPISHAIVATTDPHACFTLAERVVWARLRDAVRLVRLGCDAYAYAMVAAGTLDLVVEAGLKSWDIEAAIPLIAGAGGFITDWNGAPVGRYGGQIAIAGDQLLLDDALALLRSAAS